MIEIYIYNYDLNLLLLITLLIIMGVLFIGVIVPVLVYGIKKTFDYLYPEKVKMIKKESLKYSIKLITVYSKIEVSMINLWYKYKKYIPTIFKDNTQEIIFIKNGEEDKCFSYESFLKLKNNNKINFEYDFILHKVKVLDDNKLNTHTKCVFRYETPYNVISKINILHEQKCIKFSAITCCFEKDGKPYSVKFNYEKEQYYMNGNVLLDRPFVIWTLKKYHDITIESTDNYVITMMDNKMNIITIPDTCYIIIIDNDNYSIVNYKSSIE